MPHTFPYADIGERLRLERQRLGLKQGELSAAGGVSKTSQVNYEQGSRCPDADYLKKTNEKYRLDVLYVVLGRRSESNNDLVAVVPPLHLDDPSPHKVAEESPSYGPPRHGGLPVSKAWIERRRLDVDQLRVLEVSDASMQGVLAEGDKVLVDISDVQPRSGHVYAIRQGSEVLLKFAQLLPNGAMRVSSANPRFESYDVDLAKHMDVSVLGRMVASQHDW